MQITAFRLSRRGFLIATAGAGAGAAGLLIVGCGDDGEPDVAVLSYQRERIGALSDMEAGAPVAFSYPAETQRNFIVKLGQEAQGGVGPDGDIVAFSYICTHMGCPLVGQFKPEHNILGPCPCHFTTFDLRHRGMVVLGQATVNLPQIALDVEGDDVFATGVAGVYYGAANNLRDSELAGAAS